MGALEPLDRLDQGQLQRRFEPHPGQRQLALCGATPAQDLAEQELHRDACSFCFGAPAGLHPGGSLRPVLPLCRPGLVGGHLEDGGPLVAGQGPAQQRFPLADQAAGGRFDLGPALGELADQPLGDTFDLGSAVVVDLTPGDAEAGGELGSKGGLVEHPGRLLHLVQLASVDGEPASVRDGLDLVGD